MSSADLLNEWFENDQLKAALAASGMLASFVGPRQQGTAFQHAPSSARRIERRSAHSRLCPRRHRQSLAGSGPRRSTSGAEIRPSAEVAKIVTKNGAATGVVSQMEIKSTPRPIVSNADVKRTFFNLVEPTYLDPHFLLQVKNIRSRGTVAKINLALDALPKFLDRPRASGRAGRRHPHRPDAGISRACRR